MNHRSLRMIDVTGALLTMAMILAVVWFAFLKPDTATSQMRVLSSEVDQARADLRQLQVALDRQKRIIEGLEAEAAESGRLPEKSPVELDLRAITALARQNNVKFLEVVPNSTVRYPSVLEQRYQVKAEGSYADTIRFLKAFEAGEFWADVTHMRMEQNSKDPRATLCTSDMTLSFYSAMQ